MPWTYDSDAKRQTILGILSALPDWFGIPESIEQYGKDGRDLPCYTAERDGQTVGFVSIKETSESALEMHVLGVLPAYHRQGVGRELVAACEAYCAAHGLPILHVKTLDPRVGNAHYLMTYAFYRSIGFLPLWDEANPCQLLVKNVTA